MSALGFFNKTDKDALLASFNAANNTNFTFNDIEFSDPTNEASYTKVTVSPKVSPTEDNSLEFYYKKFNLSEFFINSPILIDLTTLTKEAVLLALEQQRQIYFRRDGVSILLGQVLLDNTPVDWPTTAFTLTLRAEALNYIWSGSVSINVKPMRSLLGKSIKQDIELGLYFSQYPQETKYPVELAYKQKVILDSFHLTFNKYSIGNAIASDSSLLSALKQVTGDDWVCVDQTTPFNIKGAVVRYRGPNVGVWFTGTRQASHVFVMELSNLCSNLKGLIKIQYADPNVTKYLNYNVDNGPIMDYLK